MPTVEDVKQEFQSNGVTIRDWAQRNGFSESLVYAVLNKKNQATRGESYQIALALGLKSRPKTVSNFILSVLDREDAPNAALRRPVVFPQSDRSECQMT